jgi:hypothetical protein
MTFLTTVRVTLVVALLGIAPLAPAAVLAGPLVSVQVASGRTFDGQIDPATDDTTLWLRKGTTAAALRRPIVWERVTGAEMDKCSLTREELQTLAKTVAAEPPPGDEAPRPKFYGVFAEPDPVNPSAEAPPPEYAPAQIRALAADAYLGNWDADVEPDGIAVVLRPLDRWNSVTPVSGSVEVELWAPQVRRFNEAPQGRGLTLERIGQWTVQISENDFSSSGVQIELPFQALHPAFDMQILPQGLVHVRLVAAGHGTFDASVEFLRIRTWSPLRDKLWRDTGDRFFPGERTGRGR